MVKLYSTSDRLVLNDVWQTMKADALKCVVDEPALSSFIHSTILDQNTFDIALVNLLSEKLGAPYLSALNLRKVFSDALLFDRKIIESAIQDLVAVRERDPACISYIHAFIHFKGYIAIQAYRFSNALFRSGRKLLAYHLQSRISEIFSVDINPAAQIGSGIMLDHATGFVMGETAIIGNNCSILQGVTLGGTGNNLGDRHPKVGDYVLIGANASVLGNIKIGQGTKIAAGSVVLDSCPENCTLAGVPAKILNGITSQKPSNTMVQNINYEV